MGAGSDLVGFAAGDAVDNACDGIQRLSLSDSDKGKGKAVFSSCAAGYAASDSEDEDGRMLIADGQECTVCLESMENGSRLMWLPCAHGFHHDCIMPWIMGGHSSCPCCRHPLYLLFSAYIQPCLTFK
ncbi:unnamed protein product, partial [Closterium sp. Naga37s-1]